MYIAVRSILNQGFFEWESGVKIEYNVHVEAVLEIGIST